MPKDLEDEVEIFAAESEHETPTMESEILWPWMVALFDKGILYTEKEIYYALKRAGIDNILHDRGMRKLNLVDRVRCTCLQAALHNLWRRPQSRLRKFYGGKIFKQSGRPLGVRWMLTDGRVRID